MQSISEILAQELNCKQEYIENVIALLDEGNTIPFIARYRKEQHGAMDGMVFPSSSRRTTAPTCCGFCPNSAASSRIISSIAISSVCFGYGGRANMAQPPVFLYCTMFSGKRKGKREPRRNSRWGSVNRRPPAAAAELQNNAAKFCFAILKAQRFFSTKWGLLQKKQPRGRDR